MTSIRRLLPLSALVLLTATACKHRNSADAPPPLGTVPAAPSDLQVDVLGPTSVELTWTDNADNEDGFAVERRAPGATDFVEIATLTPDSTTTTDPGVTTGDTYAYRVRAFNNEGDSAFSNVAEVTLPAAAPAPTLARVIPESGFTVGGTPVRLDGTGFTDNNAGPNTVLFDGALATSVVTVNDTNILARTPAGNPGGVDVMVSNQNGADTAGFTYYSWPPILLPEDVRLDTGDSVGAGNSINVQICCVGANVYAVWQDARDDRADIYLNRSTDNGITFETPDRRVDSAPIGTASTWPQLACSGSSVHVVWQDNRNGKDDIYFNVGKDEGSTFLPADIRLNTDPAGTAPSSNPRICSIGQRVYVVWEDGRTGRSGIYFNRSADGGLTWLTQDVRLDTPPTDGLGGIGATAPQICCSGDLVHVVWQDDRNGATDIFYTRSTDDGVTFLGQEIQLDTDAPGTASSQTPQIDCDGTIVFVAWEDFRNGSSDIYARCSEDGGLTFRPADTRLDTDAPGSADSAAVQVCAEGGSLYAVWVDERNGTGSEVRFSRAATVGAGFSTDDVRLDTDTDPDNDSDSPHISCSGGNVFVVWDRGSEACNIYLNSSPDGGITFQDQAIKVDSAGGDADQARVCSRGATFYVVWEDERNGDNDDIYFNCNVPVAPNGSAR